MSWLSLAAEQRRHVLQRPAPQPDVHHGADQHPHHALKEPVGLDVEAHAPAVGPRLPLGSGRCGSGSAACRPWPRRRGNRARPGSRRAAASSSSRSSGRPSAHSNGGERARPRPRRVRCRSDSGAKGRTCGRESRAASGEPTATQQSRGSSALSARRSAESVQLAGALKLTPWPIDVDSGIGSAGRVGHGPATKEALQNPLEFELNRAAGGLALPPDKAGAVVL